MIHHLRQKCASYTHRLILINRNYTLLWSGRSISMLGNTLFDTVLTLWIANLLHNQSYAPLAISGIALCAALPAFLISPFAGVFVDRWPMQQTMLVTDLVRAILVFSLLLITGILPISVFNAEALPIPVKLGAIYLVIAIVSICGQFFNPSAMALIRRIIPEEQHTRAFSLSMGTGMLSWVIGPAIAGVIYARLGIQWAIIFNGVSFVWSWYMLRCIQVPEPRPDTGKPAAIRASFLAELREGLGFILANRFMRTLLLTDSLITAGSGIINALYIFFVTQNLHMNASLYGIFCAIPTLGGVVGSWTINRYAKQVGEVNIYRWSILLAGVVMVLIASQNNPVLALIGFFIVNIANLQAAVAIGPLTLKVTPEKMVGRTFATTDTVTTISALLATFISGYLSSTLLHTVHLHIFMETLNATNVLFICAGIMFILSGIYACWHLYLISTTQTSAQPEIVEITKVQEDDYE